MSVTAGQIRKALADTPDEATVMLIHEGSMRHAASLKVAPNGKIVVIRSSGNPRQSKHFSVAEDGLIGGFHAMGMPDDKSADLLERPVDSIKRRKKALGLS